MKMNKVIVILILLVSLCKIHPLIEVKGYTENVVGYYVIEKQISAYSDDAFLYVNSYFTNSTTAIPLSNNQYDIMIGLKFNDVKVNAPTSTTYETIETCKLSFYTTDDYPVQSGDTWLTIYGIKESGDVSTFSSYQDMIDREKYAVHNNVNFNELVGDGVWWNTTDIRVTTRNLVNGTERDIGFILYASSGGASRLFRTYEHNSSLAVKLYIMVFQWEIYDPTEQEGYVETYRGFPIFQLAGWLNYTDYPKDGTNPPYDKLQVVNRTYVYTTDILDGNDNVRLRRDIVNDTVTMKFGLIVRYFHDGGPSAVRYSFALYSLTEGDNFHFDGTNDRMGLVLYSDLSSHTFQFNILAYKGGEDGYSNLDDTKFSANASRIFWILFYYNNNNQDYLARVYNDYDMTDLVLTLEGTQDDGELDLNYEYAFQTIQESYPNADDYNITLLSRNNGYVATDINGTIISPEFDTIEGVHEWINNYLSHSGGGVGEGFGDLVIALMGLAGFIMIPLSFIIFIHNMQSGDVENAFYMLMVLFFMGIAFIANWLWG